METGVALALSDAQMQRIEAMVLAAMDRRLGPVESGIADLNARMAGLESRMTGLESRMAGVEGRIAGFPAAGNEPNVPVIGMYETIWPFRRFWVPMCPKSWIKAD
jgi:hypothetical protein